MSSNTIFAALMQIIRPNLTRLDLFCEQESSYFVFFDQNAVIEKFYVSTENYNPSLWIIRF